MKLGYDIENRKRLRQGLPPALMKIVHQETLIENGKTIKIIEYCKPLAQVSLLY
jgi:hypothetical protein